MANEKRLIDANALKKEIVDFKVNRCPTGTGYFTGVCVVEGMLAQAPTVDAVEVVRCKDCKHWKLIDSLNPHRECQIFYGLHEYGYLTGADDFCSYGERKDNADNR